MRVIFLEVGRYKNGTETLNVTEKDVSEKRVFDVTTKNAESYISAKKAVKEGEKISSPPKQVGKAEKKKDDEKVDKIEKDEKEIK